MTILTIVIPVRNDKRDLEELLESIERNSFRDYEIVVVDGGSTDGSKEIAKKYGAKIIEGPKKGPAVARNIGWQKATGELVYFLDADRVIGKNTLEKAVREFEENPDVHVATIETKNKHITTNWVSKAISAENKALKGKNSRSDLLNRLRDLLT